MVSARRLDYSEWTTEGAGVATWRRAEPASRARVGGAGRGARVNAGPATRLRDQSLKSSQVPSRGACFTPGFE